MQRFWDKVQKAEGCWRWVAARYASGYGQFRWKGQAATAHRVAFELEVRTVTSEEVVLHRCGNRLCVRPSHLYAAPKESSARNPPSDPVARFWAKVKRSPGQRCWLWQGGGHPFGYGQLHLGGGSRHVLAHRYSWELAFGKVPRGRYVLHYCDNPKCVRPDHLFLGTQRDNVADMVQKGRQRNQHSGR